MRKFLKPLLPIFILFSCKSNTESKVEKSLRLFEEAGTSMITGFKLEVRGSDSSKIYYREALNKFMESYLTDSTNLDLAIYLPDVYYKLGLFDSAILWQSRLKPIDSIYNLSNNNRPRTFYGPPQDSFKLKTKKK